MSDDLISAVVRDPQQFGDLFEAMLHEDPIVRGRAANAVDELSRNRPDLLAPYRKRLIDEVGQVEQPEVRRRVALMLSRIRLDPKERSRAVALLERYLHDKSVSLVLASIETLVDFSQEDRHLRKRVTSIVERMAKRGTPSMQTRAKKLLMRLQKQTSAPTKTSARNLSS